MLYVQIVEKKTNVCDLQMDADSEREADKLKRGASINLNHTDFKVVISKTKAVVGEKLASGT